MLVLLFLAGACINQLQLIFVSITRAAQGGIFYVHIELVPTHISNPVVNLVDHFFPLAVVTVHCTSRVCGIVGSAAHTAYYSCGCHQLVHC